MSVLVYDCGAVENTVTAILDTESGAMIIRGNGDIDNYADESSPWYSEHSDILQVTVDKGITRIGSGTFYGCENLSFVEIASTVTSIGADVFQNCTSLTSIKIPKSITDIGNGTFTDSGLTEVKFYGNPPTVGTDIFDGVTADIYTPEGNEEWTETAKGTVAGNGSNLTWKEFDSKPNLIEYDELDYFWSKIKKWVNDNKSDSSLPIIDDKTFIKYLAKVVSDSSHVNTNTTLYVSNPEYFAEDDCFYIKKDSTHFFYGIVSAVNNNTGALTYAIPASDGGTFFSPDDGQLIVNYGNPMNGGVYLDWANDRVDLYKNHTVSLERDYNIYDPILNINAWDSTTASIAEEDGVVDISGEDNHGQAYGGVTVVNDKVMGRCFYFDGTDDYIILPAVDLSSGTFTVSLTFKNTDFSSVPIILDMRTDNNQYANIMVGAYSNTMPSKLRVVTYIDSSTSNTYTTTSDIFHQNIEDINITLVFTEGTNLKIYINDVLDSSHTITGNFVNANQITLGHAYTHNSQRGLIGCIKDFRIFDKALTPEEVQVIHNQSLVTQYLNSNIYNPILNLDADYSTTASIAVADGVIDVSGNQNNGQAYGGVVVNNGVYEFDTSSTSSQYIHINKNINWNTSFTINIKCNITDTSLTPFLFDCRPVDNSTDNFFIALYSSSNPKLRVVFLSNSSNTYVTTNTLNLNTDYNITVSLDINTNVLKTYINGVLDSTHTVTNKSLVSTTANIIGLNAGLTLSRMIGGQLSNIKIFDRALTAEEVYNVYQQSLNPEAFENPEKLISYDEINVHNFSGDAIQLDHLVRLGNLNGIADITDDRYGIFLGDERSYLKYDSVDGLKLINSNFALDGSILSDNFLWIDGNGNVHDDINMEIASDVDKGITNGQRYTEEGSMLNMTSGAFVTPNVRFDNRGSFYTKSKAFFENPDNVSTFFDVKYTTIESKGNIVLYDYQDNYGDSTSPYEEGPGTIAMFTLGNKNATTGLRNLSGIKLNGSLNSNGIPSMMTLARTTGTTVDDNGNVSSYTINKSSTVSHPFWLPVIQMSNLIYDENTDKTDLYVDASVYPTALTGSNKTLNLGSPSYRWSTFYSNYGSFGNVSGMPNSSKVEIGVDTNYGRGIRIYSGTNGYAGITLCGRDCSSSTGTSANSWCIMNENGAFYLYKNTTAKLSCDASGNWTMGGSLTNSSGFIGALTGNADTATTATNTNNAKLTHTVGNTEYPLVFGSSFVITDAQQALRIGTPTATAANCPLRVKAYCAAANTQGESCLVIGNNLAKASANNSRGGLYLYGTGTTWAYFRVGDQTANKTVTLVAPADVTLTLPSATGTIALTSSDITGNAATATTATSATSATSATTATNANNLKVTHTGAAWRDILAVATGFTSASNQAVYGHNSGSVAYYVDANATSGNQRAILRLGNGTANTTAAGHNGVIWMYGTNTGMTEIVPGYNSTSSITLTLPSSTGTIALTSSNITGNAANVTGTVAIANGGTGATTRLNALKALTNENVGTNATHFLTITDSWGKGGYSSVANVKSVLGIPASGTIATTASNITGSSASCTGNAASSTYATNIRVTDTDSNTWYPLVFSTGSAASTNYAARVDADSILVYPGAAPAANTQGYCYMQLGNNKAKATAGNKCGVLRIYGTGTSYTEITSAVGSTARSISFPDKAGTVALTSDIPTVITPGDYIVETWWAPNYSTTTTNSNTDDSKSTFWHIKFNSGLLIQGCRGMSTSSGSTSLTWRTPFTKAPYLYAGVNTRKTTKGSDSWDYIYSMSTTGATFLHEAGNGFYCIAIGQWK